MSKVHTVKSAPAAASPLPTVAAPVIPVATPKAKVVALRGGPAIATVKLGAKNYRVTAQHNIDWWATVTRQLAASENGQVAVTALLEAKIPGTMIRYLVSRGYLAAVE